ncbi:MAG: C40 family peptidase [Rikenellaceae bacterium]|nr:C40 family peptidase [Rikenellaceae bacterium]
MRLRPIILLLLASMAMLDCSATIVADNPIVHPDSLVQYARQYIGTPYGYGQSNGKRFDCSGFTSFVFKHYGYTLARSSREQYLEGDSVERGQWQVGDLVFFAGRNGGQSRVGHVGIVVSVDDEREQFDFIHASTSRGVIVSHSTERYYASRYIGARRVLAPYETFEAAHNERPLTAHERIFGRLEFHPIPNLIRPHDFPPKKIKKRRRR